MLYVVVCCRTWPAFEDRDIERGVRILDSGKGYWSATQTEVEQKVLRKIYKKLGSGLLYSIERWKEIGRKIGTLSTHKNRTT